MHLDLVHDAKDTQQSEQPEVKPKFSTQECRQEVPEIMHEKAQLWTSPCRASNLLQIVPLSWLSVQLPSAETPITAANAKVAKMP